MPKTRGDIATLIEEAQGIHLDLGCGANKQPGFVGMDIRPLEGVDIVHDINVHPFPLPDECVTRVMASHLVEHIPPTAINGKGTWFPFMAFMDEIWRIGKPGCEFMISAPYWLSPGFAQDPTHCNSINEITFAYFDPLHKSQLWTIYKPKPWYYRFVSFNPNMNIEIMMMRHSESEEEWEKERKTWGPMRLE
jgi:SAM-dependent methyltransferase